MTVILTAGKKSTAKQTVNHIINDWQVSHQIGSRPQHRQRVTGAAAAGAPNGSTTCKGRRQQRPSHKSAPGKKECNAPFAIGSQRSCSLTSSSYKAELWPGSGPSITRSASSGDGRAASRPSSSLDGSGAGAMAIVVVWPATANWRCRRCWRLLAAGRPCWCATRQTRRPSRPATAICRSGDLVRADACPAHTVVVQVHVQAARSENRVCTRTKDVLGSTIPKHGEFTINRNKPK